MGMKDSIKRARDFSKPFRVTDDRYFRLKKIDPGETLGLGSADKPRAKEALAMGVEALAQLQEMLCAQNRWAVCRAASPHPHRAGRRLPHARTGLSKLSRLLGRM